MQGRALSVDHQDPSLRLAAQQARDPRASVANSRHISPVRDRWLPEQSAAGSRSPLLPSRGVPVPVVRDFKDTVFALRIILRFFDESLVLMIISFFLLRIGAP